MDADVSTKEGRKASKRTKRRRRQAEAVVTAERGVTYSDGTESIPTSVLKLGGYAIIALAWIIFVAIQGWGTMPLFNILGFLFVGIPFATVSWLKGRKGLAIFGVFLWPLAIIGAIRLARPFSWWFERFYVPTSKEAAENIFASGAKASARRSLIRQVGILDEADLDAVDELYAHGRAGEYLRSEWENGRGEKSDPLPGHYQGLFQFINIVYADIPDSADPKTLGEYWLALGVDPWVEAHRESGAKDSEFAEVFEELGVDRPEFEALPPDDPGRNAAMILRLKIANDLKDGISWSTIKDRLEWDEIEGVPLSERFQRASENWNRGS